MHLNQSSLLSRLSIWVTGLPEKVSNQCTIRWKPFLKIRLQNQEGATPIYQQAFDNIKKVIETEVLLAYPDFDKPFHIYTDASDHQLGAVIMRDKKPIAFYSPKLNAAQRRYTTTECELLSTIETCKEYKNILLGYPIIVYTDHKNNTFNGLKASDRVLLWLLLLEEYGVTFEYLPGKKNVVADALSLLDIGYFHPGFVS
jgi:RNase H-like domain found in reverse transcriptase